MLRPNLSIRVTEPGNGSESYLKRPQRQLVEYLASTDPRQRTHRQVAASAKFYPDLEPRSLSPSDQVCSATGQGRIWHAPPKVDGGRLFVVCRPRSKGSTSQTARAFQWCLQVKGRLQVLGLCHRFMGSKNHIPRVSFGKFCTIPHVVARCSHVLFALVIPPTRRSAATGREQERGMQVDEQNHGND